MPRTDTTDITIILDRSGSMESIADDTIGGFNRFVADQKSGAGEATLTLVQFDDRYEVLYAAAPIASVPPLTAETFEPRGSTALLDAIGRTIDETGRRLAAMPEPERPEQVMMMILTDGYENASSRYRLDRINAMIARQRDHYAWEFIFLGANQDAIATAATLGVAAGSALTYAATPDGTSRVFESLSERTHLKRVHKRAMSAEEFFDDGDRDAQAGEMGKR